MNRVLLVDDEKSILLALKRQLKKKVDLTTAQSGQEALDILANDDNFDVIISDMRMPGMNGVELLEKVGQKYPNIIKMMLTGNADLTTASDAVNKGDIFRFLTKPCPMNILTKALYDAFELKRLKDSERELLEKTLKGSIDLLLELLSLVNPVAFYRSQRIKKYVAYILDDLQIQNKWEFDLASSLSQIGNVIIPKDILLKAISHEKLSEEEEKLFNEFPNLGKKLLMKIPRLRGISFIIGNQLKPYRDYPENSTSNRLNLGSQILKIASDFDYYLLETNSSVKAVDKMKAKEGEYNPHILSILYSFKNDAINKVEKLVNSDDLDIYMTTMQDIKSKTGMVIIPAGHQITTNSLNIIRSFKDKIGVEEPIKVQVIID